MLYNAMLENNCSEHASRMSAMENSTKSAGEMLGKLTLAYNRCAFLLILSQHMNIQQHVVDTAWRLHRHGMASAFYTAQQQSACLVCCAQRGQLHASGVSMIIVAQGQAGSSCSYHCQGCLA
jgi:hypothetical protein